MKCDRCNFENPENESYCINCGQKLPEKPMVTHIIVKFSNKIPENNENNNYYSVTYRGPDNSEINDTAYGCIKKTMKDNKKLFIAIILNLIVAGTGHLYLKRYYRGIIFLILTSYTFKFSVKERIPIFKYFCCLIIKDIVLSLSFLST